MDSLGHYLNEIGRWPLLTPAEEIELARLHQKGLQVRREVGSRTPTRNERRLMRVGDRAGDQMVIRNLRLAVSIAKKYARLCRLNDLDDLIQYGAIGLKRAVAKFDPERGYKFSTYATKWVRQEVGRGIYNSDGVVYLPERNQQIWMNIGNKAAAFVNEHGRSPTQQELMDGTGLTPERYREITNVMLGRVSLDVPVGDGGETFGDLLVDSGVSDSASRDYGWLRESVDALPPEDRDLIAKRYGLGENHPHTYVEISAECGVSTTTAHNRTARAHERLRAQLTQLPA
jgi:RNA polymerase primary sigma factor